MGRDFTLPPVLQYALDKYLALALNVNFLVHGLRDLKLLQNSINSPSALWQQNLQKGTG